MANIYQISQDLLNIFDVIEENEGELTPELEESLTIKQNELNSKVKDYSNVIKMLESDITAIKEEKSRLNDLQKSKEKTIERLKSIIVEAIETFGDINKSGNKFIDYGTGKISVRTTESVEVEEDFVNNIVNRYVLGLKWYSDNHLLSKEDVSINSMLNYINNNVNEDGTYTEITEQDLQRITTSINIDIPIKDILSTDSGMLLMRALLNYDIFNVKAKADKKGIKEDAKSDEHFMPTYATLKTNKSITIK